MKEVTCEQCGELWPEDDMLQREDNGQVVCLTCSGLFVEEDLSCRYDETG